MLPSWFVGGAVNEGFLPAGVHVFPVTAWIALEATNAVAAGDPTTNVQWTKVDGLSVTLDTALPTSAVSIDDVIVGATQWRSTGGDTVSLRQAGGGALPPLPVGRDDAVRKVNGSIVVRVDMASIGAGAFVLDCRPGNIRDGSGSMTSATIAKSAATASADQFAAGYVGVVGGSPFAGGGAAAEVDAEIVHVPHDPGGYVGGTGGPASAAGWRTEFGVYNGGILPLPPDSGAALQFSPVAATARNELRVALSPAQRTAWLGPLSGPLTVGGQVQLAATGLTPAARSVSLPTVTWNGSDPLPALAVPTDGWTASAEDRTRELRPGVLPGGQATVRLTATDGTVTRTLELVRGRHDGSQVVAPAGTPPFLSVPPPKAYEPYVPPPAPPGGTQPPPLPENPGFRPPPTPRPQTETPKKTTTVRVLTSRVRAQKGRIAVRVRNLDTKATTRARIEVRTRSRYRIGNRKARVVTVVSRQTISLRKGQTRTYRLKLGKDATSLLRSRSSVSTTVRVVPTKSTQATVSRTLTVRR